MKLSPSSHFFLIVGLTVIFGPLKTQSQDIICKLCAGQGESVTIPSAIIADVNATCNQVDSWLRQNTVNETYCGQLQGWADQPCGCAAVPTATPTMAPTFGPEPECFSDLNDLMAREYALSTEETSATRIRIVCPNTVYTLGRADPNTQQTVGGYQGFQPKSNVHFKCGESGSSSNNCQIVDGDFQVFTIGPDPVTGAIFEGFTFENAYQGGMLLVAGGDIQFIDCIIKDNKNFGAVIILYGAQGASRRLAEGVPSDFFLWNKLVTSGDWGLYEGDEDYDDEYYHSEDETDTRELQTLQTLTVNFTNTIFEGNEVFAYDQFVRPGIVTAQTPETILVFESCIFRNNEFGDSSVQDRSWAINTGGPLTIQNTCFEDNDFLRDAPVLIFGRPELVANNNYGTADSDVACQFIVSFQDQSSVEALVNYTCIEYDATSCQAVIASSSVGGPPSSPTRQPVFGLDTASPTQSPVVPSSSGSGSKKQHLALVWALTAVGIVSGFVSLF